MSLVVAAICYRWTTNAALELLLVKTKDRRWTFPKGHVEKGESEPEAAAREAGEEAGAIGTVDPEPVATYIYPKYKKNGSLDSRDEVRAYLMRIEAVERTEEIWRKPDWFKPKAARERLARKQESWYTEQIERVVDAVIARLTR